MAELGLIARVYKCGLSVRAAMTLTCDHCLKLVYLPAIPEQSGNSAHVSRFGTRSQ